MEHPGRSPDSQLVKRAPRALKRSPTEGIVDNPPVPAVEFPPAVADWIRFLADLLTQAFLREYRERSGPR